MFYSEPRLQRESAAPEPVQATLFGKAGVQLLDGEEHRHRKSLLIGVLAPENVARLARRVRKYWGDFERWAPLGYRLPLYETSQHVLTLAVCEWMGLAIPRDNLGQLSADISSLFNDAAGRGHLNARRARRRLERWLSQCVVSARAEPQEMSPLFRQFVTHQTLDGNEELDADIIAVELLNILRPVVAVSVYLVWMTHALLCHPELRAGLAHSDAAYRRAFIDEVRRYYPFFPAVIARVKEPFLWRGHEFEEGARVLLDLHGTNHDERSWENPHEFRPDRFISSNTDKYAFIPQGGGDVNAGHRCPGEGATVAIMNASLDFLLAHLPTELVSNDRLAINMRRLPALPKDPIFFHRTGQRGWILGVA